MEGTTQAREELQEEVDSQEDPMVEVDRLVEDFLVEMDHQVVAVMVALEETGLQVALLVEGILVVLLVDHPEVEGRSADLPQPSMQEEYRWVSITIG